MSYELHNFQKGGTIYASDMNQIDAQVKKNADDVIYINNNKASKKALANTDRRLQAMYDLQNGQTWSMMTDEDADNPKASPDGSALATVTEWGGQTVVWNQLHTINRSDGTSGYGITLRQENGKQFWYEGTATSYDFFTLNTQLQSSLTVGHIYLLYINNTTKIRLFGNAYNGQVAIAKYENTVYFQTGMYFFTGETYTSATKHTPLLLDLTKMFGVTETSQVTDAMKNWVTSYAATHPAYNAGELVSADVSAVESVGKNLFNQTESFKQKTYVGTYEVGTAKLIAGESYKPSFVYEDGYIGEGSYELIYFGVTQATKVNVKHWNSYFTPSETNVYKVFVYQNGQSTHGKIAGIQVEKGTTANSYVPYKSTTFTLPTAVRTQYPLRSAGTVHDEIKWDGEKWWHVKNVGKTTINGDTQIAQTQFSENTTRCMYTVAGMKHETLEASYIDVMVLCDKLPSVSNADTYSDKCGIHRRITDVNQIVVSLSGLISEKTVSAFQTYLTNNPITVNYPLATPVTTDITELMQDWDGTLPTETGGTITFVCQDDTLWNIQSNVEFTVKKDPSSTIDDITYILGGE